MPCATCPAAHGSRRASNAWQRAIQATSHRLGEGVSELRIDVGPGYRVYFTRRGREVIILLAGGSKHTQTADIRAARQLARGLSE
jgi:putative addiction module killer protein